MKSILAALMLVIPVCAWCASADQHDLRLSDVRVVAPPPGGRTAAAYLVIQNRSGTSDALLSVSTPAAAAVDIHEMAMEGNMMRMRAVPRLPLPAGATVKLEPGGYHVMLDGLKAPLRAGDKVPLRFTFQTAGTVDVTAEVVPIGSSSTSR
ncbi:MAG TPA: copper chaperone PCu(A)C [Casimicrobiaceae bacterium]|nr:copper chaperone PCu(A)C [Casimicrobiaceae bacterium]